MKNLLTIIAVILCLWSCSPEESIDLTEAPIERADQLSLKGLEIQFPDDLFNTEIAGSTWELKQANLINALREGFEDAFDPESKTPDFIWRIEATKTAILIKTEPLITNKDYLEKFTCPEGTALYATCLSRECATDKAAELGDEMAPGESFSIHRTQFNVKICASQSLIDKIEQ